LKKPLIIGLWVAAIVGLIVVSVGYFSGVSVDVLQPQGEVANKQRDLIVFTLGLALIIIIPVFFMLFYFAWKYREGNHTAKYTPEWAGSKWLEMIWWGVPCVIIGILSVITWQSSHDLDPYRPLTSDVKPVRVQVVALQWKWLFIYPDYNIATVNDLRFPEKTPVNFEITADAPMNSFWIPSLGGQVYAMSGMTTKLHLMADTTGTYKGSSANISGEGYADMVFAAQSLPSDEFDTWVKQVGSTGGALDEERYAQLARPASAKNPSYFALKTNDLYTGIVMKYMMPDGHTAAHEAHTVGEIHE
jgi:cytochrome o ubiquinol oxidase subunit 2